MLDSLDAAAVRRWCGGGLAALRAHQHEIDELNVYPVPDGDTGTNLVLTLTSAQQALDDSPDQPAAASTPPGRTMRLMARGALLGARGNSGVIVSQILRGMADTFATTVAVRGGELTRALRMASEAAYAAVAKPVEGTVLSVVAAAAEGARKVASDDLVAVARAAALSAAEALARTPQQLPILARAGVVDAGGRGLVLLLEALVEALSPTADSTRATDPPSVGSPPTDPMAVASGSGAVAAGPSSGALTAGSPSADALVAGSAQAGPVGSGTGAAARSGSVRFPAVRPAHSGHGTHQATPAPPAPAVSDSDVAGADGWEGFEYEVQYLLDATPEAVDALRDALGGLGDSLVIVGSGEGEPPTWNVHVHVDDVGAAIEAGIVAGRPHRISVTRLLDTRHPHGPVPDSPETSTTSDPAARAVAANANATANATANASDANASDANASDANASDANASDVHVHAHATDGTAARADANGTAARADANGTATSADGTATSIDADGTANAANASDAHATAANANATFTDPDARATVVVAAGDGLTAIFAGEGATVVDRNPSIAELLAAIVATGAGRVVLLPNDANTHAVARSAAQEAVVTGVRVSVVPTRSPVQALAALAVRDPGRPFDDDVIAMAEAAGACRSGEVCTASREALTVAGRCRPGDLLGLVDGEVHLIGSDLEEVCRRLLDRLLGGGGELVTLVLGADAPADLGEWLRGHVLQAWPFVELNSYAGGQPRYHLLVGVE